MLGALGAASCDDSAGRGDDDDDATQAGGGGTGAGGTGSGAQGTGGSSVDLGTRFDTNSTHWPVPTETGLGDSEGFARVSTNLWTVLDLDGDGLADLVSAGENPTNTSGESSVWGSPNDHHWRVYRNGGSGFDTDFAHWPVPTETGLGGSEGFASVSTSLWTVLDLDGDGRTDLVSAGENPTNTSGESSVWGYPSDHHWRLYRNIP